MHSLCGVGVVFEYFQVVLTCLGFFYKLLNFEIKWRDEILLCLAVGGMCLGAGAEQ